MTICDAAKVGQIISSHIASGEFGKMFFLAAEFEMGVAEICHYTNRLPGEIRHKFSQWIMSKPFGYTEGLRKCLACARVEMPLPFDEVAQ